MLDGKSRSDGKSLSECKLFIAEATLMQHYSLAFVLLKAFQTLYSHGVLLVYSSSDCICLY